MVAVTGACTAKNFQPVINVNREGYGSDPYLHGIAAYHGVRGIQDNGVIATPKSVNFRTCLVLY